MRYYITMASNACKFWNYDDITECGRFELFFYTPILVLSVLIISTSLNIGWNFLVHKYHLNSSDFSEEEDVVSRHLVLLSKISRQSYGSVNFQNTQSLNQQHFSIDNLKYTKTDGSPHGKSTSLRRSFLESTKVILEFLIVLSQMTLHIFMFMSRTTVAQRFSSYGLLLNILEWGGLTTLVSFRLLNINHDIYILNEYQPNLWTISFICYGISFMSAALPFRAVLIKHITNKRENAYYTEQFIANLLLIVLTLSAKVRNSIPTQYRTEDNSMPTTEENVSLISFVSWTWFDNFIWQSHKSTVTLTDIWDLVKEDYSIFVIKDFKQFYDVSSGKLSFIQSLFLFFSPFFMLQAFWALIDGFLSLVPTMLLKKILDYIDDPSISSKNSAWFYVFGMFISKVFVAISQGQALFIGRRVCIRMRSIITSVIYSKALKRRVCKCAKTDMNDGDDDNSIEIELHEKENKDLGSIINLMAVDTLKVSEITTYMHSLLEASVMMIIAFILLFRLIGSSAIIGTVMIIVIMPINFKLTNLLGYYQKKALNITDKRIQKLNEALHSIHIIKYFAWEERYTKDILDIRRKELQMLMKKSCVWAMSALVWIITPTVVTTCSFGFYIFIQRKTLTTPIAFTALSLFASLKSPLDQLSMMLSHISQSIVSLERIQEFLNEEDTEKYEQLLVDGNGKKIRIENAVVSWGHNKEDFTLKDINIDFKIGKLNVILGPTGSGKTSLLMALLGEMYILEGKITVPSLTPRDDLLIAADGLTNSFAYCSQTVWLYNDTLKNNILFNSPYDKIRYDKVIDACGLRQDLEILCGGDNTEIGEKGVILSGGQKQRVSLARALYSNSRNVLLDDCLSAVDSNTASWIYENCITGELMVGRTCILVSHNISLVTKKADHVILLDKGRVIGQGNPEYLYQTKLIPETDLMKNSIHSRSLASLKKCTSNQRFRNRNPDTVEECNNDGQLIDVERKSDGMVSSDVYKWYLENFGGIRRVLIFTIIFIIPQLIYISQSWWVRYWVSSNARDESKFSSKLHRNRTLSSFTMLNGEKGNREISGETKETSQSTMYYLMIYFFIGLTQSFLAAIKIILNFMAGIGASNRIFKSLLRCTLYSKIRFFDVTPLGRIMNRFSKDIESIDQELTPYIEASFSCLIQALSTLVLITFITPTFLSVATIIAVLYCLIGYFYMAASRELKRFESITKSPIYQYFSETLVGIVTIRAYGDERRFLQDILSKIDDNNKPFFYLWVANRWLSFRIDLVGTFVIFGAGIFLLLSIDKIDAGLAGISLTYAISFTDSAVWLVRYYSTVEMNMSSVERLKEYMDIEQEQEIIYNMDVPEHWPNEGLVEFKNVSLRYADNLKPVLKNLSFTAMPNSKIGIVGRTGAGKSTLITALFRFFDVSEGQICIDHVPIESIDLPTLRSALTIIPQDPVLFSGTIRSNIDPYDEYNDEKLYRALERVTLISTIELQLLYNGNHKVKPQYNKFLNLEYELSDGGSNISQGERQLICLARSLLREPKIILLDEATASIDYESDLKIQNMIRTEFKNSTILTIAHRLQTVIDYDKILVLDNGKLKEYDNPYSLLQNKDGIFYQMCDESGELETLVEAAENAFRLREIT